MAAVGMTSFATARFGASRWLAVTLIVLIADQITKLLVVERFELFDSITINAFLDFMRLHNEGVAFSMFADSSGWQRWFFSGLGVVVTSIIVIWITRLPAQGQNLLAAGLASIAGGALGNVIDRILRGHVIDFIRVHYEDAYFPAFNIADSAITVGAAMIILDSIIQTGRARDAVGKNSGA